MNRKFHTIASAVILALITALGSTAFGQQEQSSSSAEKPAVDSAAATPAKPPPVEAGTSNDRLFNLLPNFLTLENAANAPVLSTPQKFKVVARGTFDYIQFPWWGLLAGINQLEDGEPGYGQGAKGYGKRFASYAVDGTIENFMVGAVLPSLFHQDPRYYQSGKGGFFRRTGYAISRLAITRSDSGAKKFNYSEVLGSAISSTVSTYSYHPKEDRTIASTASTWGSQLAYDALSVVVKEFWPDIRRKMNKKAKT